MGEWMGSESANKPSPFMAIKPVEKSAPAPSPAPAPAPEEAIPMEGLDDTGPPNQNRPRRKRSAAPTADAPAEAAVEKVRKKPGPKPGSKREAGNSRNNRKSPMTDGPGQKVAEAAALARLHEENARLRKQISTEQPAKPAGDHSEQVQLAVAQTKNKAAAAMIQFLMRQQGMGAGPSDCSTPGSASSSQTPIANPFLSFFTDDV